MFSLYQVNFSYSLTDIFTLFTYPCEKEMDLLVFWTVYIWVALFDLLAIYLLSLKSASSVSLVVET